VAWRERKAEKAVGGGEAAAPRRAVADAAESAAPRYVGAVAIVLPAGLLVQALVNHASYRHPVVPVVVALRHRHANQVGSAALAH